MIPKFKNLIQLLDYFKDQETCIKYLEHQRWGGCKPSCPFCGWQKVYKTNRGYKCANSDCYKKFSATVGTMYENTKIPLRIWFGAVYLATAHKKGISSLQLKRDLGISQKTAWFVLHRIREMVKVKNPKIMTTTVELDETYVGGKNKNRHASKKVENSQGRSAKDKTPVFGILERDGNLIAMKVVNTTGDVLKAIISKNVAVNTKIMTDEHRAYYGLSEHYIHSVVNHSAKNYVNDDCHTNTLEGFWSLFKRGLYGIYHSVSAKHLDRYTQEFVYRYNTRLISDPERFELSVKNCVGRLKYKDLIAKV